MSERHYLVEKKNIHGEWVSVPGYCFTTDAAARKEERRLRRLLPKREWRVRGYDVGPSRGRIELPNLDELAGTKP